MFRVRAIALVYYTGESRCIYAEYMFYVCVVYGSANCAGSAVWVYDLIGFEVAKCMYVSFFVLALFT